jgi:hypothetical protein
MLDFFKPDESKQITRIDLQPEESIRSVQTRFRICRYLFRTGAIWLGIGVILGLIFNHRSDSEFAFEMTLIGVAIYTIAFALNLAIYRCPVCDKFLSRVGKTNLTAPAATPR